MSKYIIRLDDACEYMQFENWKKIGMILSRYNIRPLVGIIPKCADNNLINLGFAHDFWKMVDEWKTKGWEFAMHGFNHVYLTESGGMNPVNFKSEFAGVSLEQQEEKIENGLIVLEKHDIKPRVFFAPSHTFDENTLIALKKKSNINIISDTIANDVYFFKGFTFVPQQAGSVRKMPLKIITFCYHPNTMNDNDFARLELFLKKNSAKFIPFPVCSCTREKNIFDKVLSFLYFARRKK